VSEVLIELIGGPLDGLVKHETNDPGMVITVPGPSWPKTGLTYQYFWSGRMTEDGRRAYVLAKYHPLRT
jgi:hypothetical protein